MATVREQLEALQQKNEAAMAEEIQLPEVVVGPGDKPADVTNPDQELVTAPTAGTPTAAPTGEPAPIAIQGTPQVGEAPTPGAQPEAVDQTLADGDRKALEALRAKTQGVMNEKQEYGLPVTPKEMPQSMGPFLDYVAGINHQMVKALSLPNEAIDEIMGAVGLGPGANGQYSKHTEALLKKWGIQSYELDNFANKVGRETFNGVATATALMAAAPTMAANTGTNVVSVVTRELGKLLSSNRTLQVISELGAAPGAEYGRQEGGTLGGFAGALGGALGASTVAGVTGKVAKGAVNLGAKALGLGKKPAPAYPESIVDPYADPANARVFAQNQLEGDKLKMEAAAQSAIASINRSGTDSQAQTQVRNSIDAAEEIGNRIVKSFWERTPQTERIPMNGIRDQLRQMAVELKDTPSSTPTDFMEKLSTLTQPMRDPATGRMVKSLPTVKRLRDERGSIRRARLEEQAKVAPNDGLIRNYNRLESMIDDAITTALPDDVTVQQARNMSIKYHDIFSRGPIADMFARRKRGDMSVQPGQTMDNLMGKFGGLDSLLEISGKLTKQTAPWSGIGPPPLATTAGERGVLNQSVIDAENSIRTMFRESTDAGGAEGGIKFFRKNESTIKPLARVYAELQSVTDRLVDNLEAQKVIQKSALAKFTQQEPQYAIRQIYTSPDPAAKVKELIGTLGKNDDALAGFRNGLVDHVLTQAKGDGLKMKEILSTPRYQDMLREALTTEQYARLNRVVDIAFRIGRGDEKDLRKAFMPSATIISRIIGAAIGRKMTNTLQGPAIISRAFQKSAERWLRITPPNDLMVKAIEDPRWESLLLMREPRSTREMRAIAHRVRRVVAYTEAMRQHEFSKKSEGLDDEQ
jgi:hypothetical protein